MGGWKNSEESLKANARNFIWPRELVLEIDIGVNILVTPSGRLMMAMYPELVFVKLSANDLVSVYGNINIKFLHVIQCCNTQIHTDHPKVPSNQYQVRLMKTPSSTPPSVLHSVS